MNDQHMPETLKILKDGAEKMGIELTPLMEKQFILFGNRLLEKNQVMNLTTVTDPAEIQIRHFLDSLSLNMVVPLENQSYRTADMGTGGGFPGIPLKIAFPSLKITLMDSLKKRLNFLNDIIDELRCEEIETLHGRAEDIGRNSMYRETFDLCVSRAVANLSSLCEYCLPLVRKGGMMVAYKTLQANREISDAEKAVRILGGKVMEIKEFTLPGTDMGRTLVVIEKIQATPAIYPRKAGTPAKDPIH